MTSAKHPASPVPRSRFKRLVHIGGLAGRVASGMLAEDIRQVARGNMPITADLVLTPANARRVSEKLSELRGTVMKLGQLLSMNAGNVMQAIVTTPLLKFQDDVQLMFFPDDELIQARSSSQLDLSDLGTNEKRLATLRKQIKP